MTEQQRKAYDLLMCNNNIDEDDRKVFKTTMEFIESGHTNFDSRELGEYYKSQGLPLPSMEQFQRVYMLVNLVMQMKFIKN